MPKKSTVKNKNPVPKQLSLFDDSRNLQTRANRTRPQVQRDSQKTGVTKAEVLDPDKIEELSDKDVRQVWLNIRRVWFPDRVDLDSYLVKFSRRKQKRTLACCDVFSRKVTVARELAYKKHTPWLAPLLYHEMCHAVLGSTARRTGKRRNLHGLEFKTLEMRHPEIVDLNQWIADGGWVKAIRSDRAKRAARDRS